jgi:hypothetical protein
MSDIPLHSVRNARRAARGYAPIPNSEEDQSSRMSSVASRAAAASANIATRKNIGRARRKDLYQDDPEEGASLLGEEQDEGGFADERDQPGPAPAGQQVCCMLVALGYSLLSGSSSRRRHMTDAR